jgi:hypothetical protein
VTLSPQKTLAGLVFHLSGGGWGGGAAQDQQAASPKSFTIEGAPGRPLCENIKDTLGISIII